MPINSSANSQSPEPTESAMRENFSDPQMRLNEQMFDLNNRLHKHCSLPFKSSNCWIPSELDARHCESDLGLRKSQFCLNQQIYDSKIRLHRQRSLLATRKSQSDLGLLKPSLVEEHISIASFGKLTNSKPMKLLSRTLSCTLQITDAYFELLYDDGDSVFPNLAKPANRNRTWKRPQYRSPKVWVSGSVTKKDDTFTLNPSKLIVSICGVEQGLFRSTGGLLDFGQPALDVNPVFGISRNDSTGPSMLDAASSYISSTLSSFSDESTRTLTKSWFACEGFLLNSTRDKVKHLLIKLLPFPKDIGTVIWGYLPESKFKDRVDIHNSLKWTEDGELKENKLIFQPFCVRPKSLNEMTVSKINLEACVYNKLDGACSSVSLRKLNGSFIVAQPQSEIDITPLGLTFSDSFSSSWSREEKSSFNYFGGRTLNRCQTTPEFKKSRYALDLVKCQSLTMDVVDEDDVFAIPDLQKFNSLDTLTNEIVTKTAENVPQWTDKESGVTKVKAPDEESKTSEVVPPELSSECCWKDNDDCEDLDFLQMCGAYTPNYRNPNLGVFSNRSNTKSTKHQLRRYFNFDSNQRSLTSLINDFETRIEDAVLVAMSSKDNQCRNTGNFSNLKECKSPSYSEIESESLSTSVVLQKLISEDLTRMTVYLRPECARKTTGKFFLRNQESSGADNVLPPELENSSSYVTVQSAPSPPPPPLIN